MVPLTSHKVSRVSWYSGSCSVSSAFTYGAFTLSGRLSQNRSVRLAGSFSQSLTPACSHAGLGSSHFARRYFGNRVFFLFLRVLRCFSSPGSPPHVMDWRVDTRGLLVWVSPFGHPRLSGYLLLPAAFRSLSRPSSALSAKASALRSFCLTICCSSVNSLASFLWLLLMISHLRCLPIFRVNWDPSQPTRRFFQGLFLMYAIFKVHS